jgi:hypothetical protein
MPSGPARLLPVITKKTKRERVRHSGRSRLAVLVPFWRHRLYAALPVPERTTLRRLPGRHADHARRARGRRRALQTYEDWTGKHGPECNRSYPAEIHVPLHTLWQPLTTVAVPSSIPSEGKRHAKPEAWRANSLIGESMGGALRNLTRRHTASRTWRGKAGLPANGKRKSPARRLGTAKATPKKNPRQLDAGGEGRQWVGQPVFRSQVFGPGGLDWPEELQPGCLDNDRGWPAPVRVVRRTRATRSAWGRPKPLLFQPRCVPCAVPRRRLPNKQAPCQVSSPTKSRHSNPQ